MEKDDRNYQDIEKLHRKKMIAPIIISVILIVYYACFGLTFIIMPGMPAVVRLFMGIIPLVVAGVIIYVLVERLNEIRSGEEDDISKY